MYALSCLPSSIFVGRQDEKNYRTIEFDVSEWVAKFPQANIYIAAYRPDGYIYLPEVELAGDKLIWHVSEADAAAPGNGEIELRVADNELLGKSQKISTIVTTSISGNGGSLPVPPPDWTEEAAALDARVTYLEQHGTGGGFDIHSLRNEDNIADADETPFYDASADRQRKTTWANIKAKLKAYFDNLYIKATELQTAINTALAQAKASGEFDGEQGPKGDTGPQGADGASGVNGKSAYEIAVEHGFIGAEQQWLASLKGETGARGRDGAPGHDGADGQSFNWRGAYDANTEYVKNDVVSHEGACWIYADSEGTTGATPGVNPCWHLMAEKGANGYTPVKGTDYFTDPDKIDIAQKVLEALPMWPGGFY